MFSYLDNPLQQTTLSVLLLLWALLLFGGFIVGPNKDGRRMSVWTRLGSSLVLVVAAFIWTLISRDYGVAWYALLLAAGMILGFLGDLFLAKVIITGKTANLSGIAAFALGHLFYITAIWHLGSELGLTAVPLRSGALLAWWLLGALGWYFIVYRGAKATALHWVVLVYALLLATTAGAATGLALQESAFWPLAVGAALFLFSDTLIGGNWFNGLDFPSIHDLIWLTYGPGQMLIVFSAGTAVMLII